MDIQPVDQMLCDCLGRAADQALAKRLETLSPSEWQMLVEHADRHGVTPLLYHRLKKLTPAAPFSASVMNRLRAIYLSSALRNTKLYDEAGRILAALAAANIRVIALKGIYLADCIYGNIALRPMSDIDILVRKDDLARAVEIFAELGYTPREPFQIESACAASKHLPSFLQSNGGKVDVHWTIALPASSFVIDPDDLWERAQRTKIVGVELLTLSAEDTLLHLSLHSAYDHLFAYGLRSVCDISKMLRHFRNQIDWEQVSCRARQWGAGHCVYLNLYLAQQLLGADVPKDALLLLKPVGFDETIASLARDNIFENNSRDDPQITPDVARLWSDIRISQKAIILMKKLFIPPKILNGTYPASSLSWRIFLYFPARLKSLLFRYSLTLWNLIRRDKEMIISLKRQQQDNRLREWLSGP